MDLTCNGNGEVISSHTFLGVSLRIHAQIKVDLYLQKCPLIYVAEEGIISIQSGDGLV